MSSVAVVMIDRDRPDAHAIERAAAIVRGGGIVAVPTETLYGFAVDPWSVPAVTRLIAIKRRADDKGIPVLIGDLASVDRVATAIPPAARRLIARHWPGPLTIVLDANEDLPREVAPAGVAVRWTACAAAGALAAAAGGAITGTSANRSGDARPPLDPLEIAAEFGAELDLVLDAGLLPPSLASTVVDARTDPPRVLREGAVPAAALFGQPPTDRA